MDWINEERVEYPEWQALKKELEARVWVIYQEVDDGSGAVRYMVWREDGVQERKVNGTVDDSFCPIL